MSASGKPIPPPPGGIRAGGPGGPGARTGGPGAPRTTGYTARLELVKELNGNLEGTLHGAYFNLPGPDYSFWAAGVGIKYHF